MIPVEPVLKSVAGLPSPQVTCTAHGESAPGSEKLPRVKLLAVPSVPVWSAAAETDGATLLTVTSAEEVLEPSSLSWTWAPTEQVPLSGKVHWSVQIATTDLCTQPTRLARVPSSAV